MLRTRPKGQQPHGAHWCNARTQGRQEKGGQLPKHSVEAEPVALGLGFPPPMKQTWVFHSAAPKWSAVGTAARCLCSGRLPQRRGCPVKRFPIPLVGGHSLSFSSPSSLLSPRELTRGIANALCMALLRTRHTGRLHKGRLLSFSFLVRAGTIIPDRPASAEEVSSCSW